MAGGVGERGAVPLRCPALRFVEWAEDSDGSWEGRPVKVCGAPAYVVDTAEGRVFPMCVEHRFAYELGSEA